MPGVTGGIRKIVYNERLVDCNSRCQFGGLVGCEKPTNGGQARNTD